MRFKLNCAHVLLKYTAAARNDKIDSSGTDDAKDKAHVSEAV